MYLADAMQLSYHEGRRRSLAFDLFVDAAFYANPASIACLSLRQA
jgi:hypothetical protein